MNNFWRGVVVKLYLSLSP